MASMVAICNIALTRAGCTTISSLDEATNEARQCKLEYESIRDQVLRAYPWSSATKIVALALTNEKIPGWQYAYSYPADCLLMRKVYSAEHAYIYSSGSDHLCLHDIDNKRKVIMTSSGRVVLSNIDSAYAEYTFRNTNTESYDPELINSIAWALSYAISVSLTGNKELREHLYKLYVESVQSAHLSDKIENCTEVLTSNKYIKARY